MISILIPVFNQDIRPLAIELHKQCEEAVIEFEILIFEDGSTKYLLENSQIKNYKNIKYTIYKENVGRAAIRNKLAESAKYEHLIFVDCDAKVCSPNFIGKYLPFCKENCVVFGGIKYDEKIVAKKYSLRLKYGKERESKNAIEREKDGKFSHFTTFNFLIPKKIFNPVKFDESINGYGHEDTIFGYQLSELNVEYYDTDNPLIHTGLDENNIFIEKTKKSVENLLFLSDNDKYSKFLERSKLHKTFRKVEQKRLTKIFGIFYSISNRLITKLLSKKNPSLMLLDLYKLLYMCYISNTSK